MGPSTVLRLDRNRAANSEKLEPFLSSLNSMADLGYLPLDETSSAKDKHLWEI